MCYVFVCAYVRACAVCVRACVHARAGARARVCVYVCLESRERGAGEALRERHADKRVNNCFVKRERGNRDRG